MRIHVIRKCLQHGFGSALLIGAACQNSATTVHARSNDDGPSPYAASAGTLGAYFRIGPLSVSVTQVSVTKCLERPHGLGQYKAGPNHEFLVTVWNLRNTSNKRFSLPHPNHPGFRRVANHRLYPGTYLSYPGYGSQLPAHSYQLIAWTFVIPFGTSRVDLTYWPPGPRRVSWTVSLPRISRHEGCV